MSQQIDASGNDGKWICGCCGAPLVMGKVNVHYMNTTFKPELVHCGVCEIVFIPEDLAEGKMAEVEKTLEDK